MKFVAYIIRSVLMTTLAAILNCPMTGGEQPLKVVSYNIYEGMRMDASPAKDAFVSWVRTVNPDILALQEAQGFTQQSLEGMARRYGHPYAVLLKEDGYPVALTSRLPIVEVQKVIDNMHHGFIRATIAGYNILAIHLSPHTYRKRREEVDLLLATVRASPETERWIIMGDFNSESRVDAVRHDHGKVAEGKRLAQLKFAEHDNLASGKLDYEVIDRVLAAGFVDVVHEATGGAPATRPSKLLAESHTAAPARIDFIFVSGNIKGVLGAGVLKDEFTDMYSDHYPVWLTVKK